MHSYHAFMPCIHVLIIRLQRRVGLRPLCIIMAFGSVGLRVPVGLPRLSVGHSAPLLAGLRARWTLCPLLGVTPLYGLVPVGLSVPVGFSRPPHLPSFRALRPLGLIGLPFPHS